MMADCSSMDHRREHNTVSDSQSYALDYSRFISQAWSAIFLTECHNFDEEWCFQQVNDLSCVEDLKVELTLFQSSYEAVTEEMAKLKQLDEEIQDLRGKVEALRQSSYSTFLPDFSDRQGYTIQEILDHLSLPLNSNEHIMKTTELALKNEKLRHDLLNMRLTSLKSKLTSKAKNMNKRQTKIFHNWHSQKLGKLGYNAANKLAVLRLEQPSLNKAAKTNISPLVRGLVHRNSFGAVTISKLQVVWSQNDMVNLSDTISMALAPGPLIACMQQALRVNKALDDDIGRLRSVYAFDWDSENRNLHLLTGIEGTLTATIHVDLRGMPSLVSIKSSANRTHDHDLIVPKVDGFTPPLIWSLDEWLMEVNDYCKPVTN